MTANEYAEKIVLDFMRNITELSATATSQRITRPTWRVVRARNPKLSSTRRVTGGRSTTRKKGKGTVPATEHVL